MTASPEELERAAQYVRAKADDLVSLANAYAQRTAQVEWTGKAAQGFREDVVARLSDANHARQRLEEVAAALRRGAEHIRRERERQRREAEERRRRGR